jgi:hypothetical protein
MVYDNIIIGSGLTALATAYGLPSDSRTLVLTGGEHDTIGYYDLSSKTPCQNQGFGGLGNFWHGVIPMDFSDMLASIPVDVFTKVFKIFYPRESPGAFVNSPWLFVPYSPIRPKPHWGRLLKSRAKCLSINHTTAQRVQQQNGVWLVQANGQFLKTNRLWIAAGALGTPALLERSGIYSSAILPSASDHVILYAGQTNRKTHPQIPSPEVKHTSSGYWMRASADYGSLGLITTKPARFSYKVLDQGIEERSAFGLPASSVVKKLISAGSLGFVAEAAFNKLGLLPDSQILSVYAQIRVKDAYIRLPGMRGVQVDNKSILSSIKEFRKTLNSNILTLSRREDLYIRGIHLHRTLNTETLATLGINSKSSNCHVVDASAVDDVGPEHHTFRLMARAYHLAYTSGTNNAHISHRISDHASL